MQICLWGLSRVHGSSNFWSTVKCSGDVRVRYTNRSTAMYLGLDGDHFVDLNL